MTVRPPSGLELRAHHKRITGMLDDPQCTGDLLALGTALAYFTDFEMGQGRGSLLRIARRAFPNTAHLRHHMNGILRGDIRRYDPDADPENRSYWDISCGAPMIRKTGPCGVHATTRYLLVDYDSGRERWTGACSRKEHKRWLETVFARNRPARGAEDCPPPPPVPAANTGGVLARHIPEINWTKIYQLYKADWSPPPEDRPWMPPTFSLHLGDVEDDAGDDGDAVPPPVLAVVTGDAEGIRIDGAAQ